MARARDFNGSANETIVVSPKDVKGKVKDSILGKKARLWLLTINNGCMCYTKNNRWCS